MEPKIPSSTEGKWLGVSIKKKAAWCAARATFQIETGLQAQGNIFDFVAKSAKATNWRRTASASIFLCSLSTMEVRMLNGCKVITDLIWQQR
jgi:hypothetical protein